MTLTISKSQNLTKDPEQSPNPYLRPFRKKRTRAPKRKTVAQQMRLLLLNSPTGRTRKAD